MGFPAALAFSRTRPVIDPAIDSLAEHADAIAQAWAAALVGTRPPERIGDVPLAEIARDGPQLCAAIVRALQSDLALLELSTETLGGVSAVRAAAGAGGAAQLAADVETLRGVIWQRLERALATAPLAALIDAADRLAAVCSATLGAALAAAEGEQAPTAVVARPQAAHVALGVADALGTAGGEKRSDTIAGPRAERPPVIVDEGDPPPGWAAHVRTHRPSESEGSRADQGPGTGGETAPEPGGEPMTIRAARGGEGPDAWVGLLRGQLGKHLRDGLPFSVLLAELIEPGDPSVLARTAPRVEQTLAAELAATSGAGAGLLTRERAGRWWLLAPGVDGEGAERLGERLTRAAQATPTAAGRRVLVAIGSASCPHDGSDAATLAAHADVGLYAARAALRRRRGAGQTVV